MTKPSGIKTVKVESKKGKGAKAVEVQAVPEEVLTNGVEEMIPAEVEMTPAEADAILEAIPVDTPAIPEVLAEAIGETASERQAKPAKEKKEKKPKEVKIKVVPTAEALTEVKEYITKHPDLEIEKSKDGPNQFFVLYKAVKVLYISPNFVSVRPEDAEKLGLVSIMKGYHHPFKANLGALQGKVVIQLLELLQQIYPKVKEVKPAKEKKEKEIPAEEKIEEKKIS